MPENMMTPEHKATNKEYRDGYDRIFKKKNPLEESFKRQKKRRGFYGLTPQCKEGAPCHPDKFGFYGSDEAYLMRLQAYADEFGVEQTNKTICTRTHLLEKLKEKK